MLTRVLLYARICTLCDLLPTPHTVMRIQRQGAVKVSHADKAKMDQFKMATSILKFTIAKQHIFFSKACA
jgi:hypothetical protein